MLLLLAGGCADRFVDFRVTRLLGVQVVKVAGQGFEMQVRCELENPNPLAAEVDQIFFEVRSQKDRLGEGQLPGPVAVPARGRFQLRVPIRVAFADLPADFPSRVRGGELDLITRARIRARTSLGTYQMQLTSSGSTRLAESLPVLLQGSFQGEALQVQRIELAGLELRRVRLRLRLLARNLFPFPIRIQRGEFRLDVNDRFFGESQLEQPLPLPPRSRRPTEVTIVASHGTVAAVLLGMLAQDPRFRVRGTLWVDPIAGISRIPLDLSADSSVFASDGAD